MELQTRDVEASIGCQRSRNTSGSHMIDPFLNFRFFFISKIKSYPTR